MLIFEGYWSLRLIVCPETHSVTGQTMGTLNSMDSKSINALEVLVFLCQSYCMATP